MLHACCLHKIGEVDVRILTRLEPATLFRKLLARMSKNDAQRTAEEEARLWMAERRKRADEEERKRTLEAEERKRARETPLSADAQQVVEMLKRRAEEQAREQAERTNQTLARTTQRKERTLGQKLTLLRADVAMLAAQRKNRGQRGAKKK